MIDSSTVSPPVEWTSTSAAASQSAIASVKPSTRTRGSPAKRWPERARSSSLRPQQADDLRHAGIGSASVYRARHVADAPAAALPPELADGGFDLVYTATGVLVWIPDIDRWASAVAGALAAGGRFLLFEAHPVEMCLWGVDGRVEITEDYFDTGRPVESVGWSHFEGAEDAREASVEFGWTLGQVVTALAAAGLRIERLEEYPTESEWRFGEAMATARRLPGTILLIARRA